MDDLLISEFRSLEVPRHFFELQKEIGRGEFGVVMMGSCSTVAQRGS